LFDYYTFAGKNIYTNGVATKEPIRFAKIVPMVVGWVIGALEYDK
jgi:hypothetical protein